MKITEFINAPEESWRDIPNTNLEASSYGRIRNIITKAWYGEVVYMDDMADILAGKLAIWTHGVVSLTNSPRSYFLRRSRHEKEDENALMAEYAMAA